MIRDISIRGCGFSRLGVMRASTVSGTVEERLHQLWEGVEELGKHVTLGLINRLATPSFSGDGILEGRALKQAR